MYVHIEQMNLHVDIRPARTYKPLIIRHRDGPTHRPVPYR